MTDSGKKKPEPSKPDSKKPEAKRPPSGDEERRFVVNWPAVALVSLLMGALAMVFFVSNGSESLITYDFFESQLLKNNIESVTIQDTVARGVFKTPPPAPLFINSKGERVEPPKENGKPKVLKKFYRTVLPNSGDTQNELKKTIEQLNQDRAARKEPPIVFDNQPAQSVTAVFYFFSFMLLALVLGGMFLTMRRNRDPLGPNGMIGGFTRSTAKKYEGKQAPITFADVAGLEGVKADLHEIVDFLKAPEKFRRLGGHVPKGVLLNGPPGTGKTLLARAIAGEAGAPFFSVNGSEFIQLFVGVGASRVRDLFQQAKAVAPAIVFIDEIDAVGRQRGTGLGGGHDEREQTLNQILSEMDGFSPVESVIVIASTNRPDVLDPALLRPGRFDRHIFVGRPTMKGRLEILKVHVRDVPLNEDVKLERIAARTVGMTGADLRNLVNEAALWAARKDQNTVTYADFDYAFDKVVMGSLREEVLSPEEKKRTAYHESGHALAAWRLPHANRVAKVTIVPRGRALGVTQMLPIEDRLNVSEEELKQQLIVFLAGRAAEKLVYDETSVGAENDLERATSIARRMVTQWGMSEKLGPVSYKLSDQDPFLGKELHQQRHFSEHTMEVIDAEVAKILHEAAAHAQRLLSEGRDDLEALTQALLDREEIEEFEIRQILGPSAQNPHPDPAPAEALPAVRSQAVDPSQHS
jgi:cell division protease FtsH